MQNGAHEISTQMANPVQLEIKNCDRCVYSRICRYRSYLHSDGCMTFTDTDILIPVSNIDEVIKYCENMFDQINKQCYSIGNVEAYSQFIEKLKQLDN